MSRWRTDSSGKSFKVVIYEDLGYVIKYPKTVHYKNYENLKMLVDIHNFLSKHVKEILPCEMYNKNEKIGIKMQLAKGVRCDIILDTLELKSNKQSYYDFLEKMDAMKGRATYKVHELGYVLTDLRPMNIFYDHDNNKFSIIDIDTIRKVKSV